MVSEVKTVSCGELGEGAVFGMGLLWGPRLTGRPHPTPRARVWRPCLGVGEGPGSSQRPDCVGRGACPDPAEVPLRWPAANRGPLSARHGVPEVRVRAGSPSSALGLPVATTCPGYPPLAVGTRAGGGAALPEFTARERRKHEVRTAWPCTSWGFHLCVGCPRAGRRPFQGRGLF